VTSAIEIGRLLRAGTGEFIVGCRVGATEVPAFGDLIRAPLDQGYQVFGLIHDVRIEDDGLVRQLVAAGEVPDEVVRDNRERRIVPVEISAIVVGWESNGVIRHQLPPRPPLSLDRVYLCDVQDVLRFTADGRLSYLRLLLEASHLPVGELLAAHVAQVGRLQPDPSAWIESAVTQIIGFLRDDYPMLSSVLASLQAVVDRTTGDKGDKE